MNGKVYYIDFMQNEGKTGNMGVIRGDRRGFSCVIHLPRQFHELKCAVYAINKQGEKKYLTDVFVIQGRGQVRYDVDEDASKEWKSIWIQVSGSNYGICKLQADAEMKNSYVENKKERLNSKIELDENINRNKQFNIEQKIDIEKNEKDTKKIEEKFSGHKENDTYKKDSYAKDSYAKDSFIESLPPMKTDKWEQLLQLYPQVHIFPEAETIVIKPKDMIVLTKEHQDLATNSFVLHAYYNYRQLLLIRYLNKANKQYYIGVPGIFFEREKRVAMLFGFEGFENGEARLAQASGKNTYVGCFGYYVKQVDI